MQRMLDLRVFSNIGLYLMIYVAHRSTRWQVHSESVPENPLLYKGNEIIDFDSNQRNNILHIPRPYFPYYGRLYDKVFISRDGLVAFEKQVDFEDKVFNENGARIETDQDVPFIAPYRFNATNNSGKVYYRTNFTGAESEYLGKYIEDSVLGVAQFRPTWILVVTWDRVEYESHTNTVQLVLLTDHFKSFALYNYGDMNIPLRKTFQSGFNGGYGLGWTEAIPFNKLPYAHQNTGSDVTGRYIYQVNDNVIKRGGCLNYRDYFSQLAISPSSAGMLGGEMLNLSGPCLKPSDKIICKFGHDEALAVRSPGFVISTTRASCPMPKLLQRGRVKLSMSIDNGESYYYSSYIYIVHPLDIPPKVLTLSNEVDRLTAESITLRWNATELTHHHDALVDIQLIGYFENTNWGVWAIITKVAERLPVSRGNVTFRVGDFPCIASDCTRFDVGFLEVKLQDVRFASSRRSLNGKIFPLTWFKHKAMTISYGANWPSHKCNQWYESDKTSRRWYREIADCPCTLTQALVDTTGWIPDKSCNMFGDRSCSRHKGATHCVESVQKTFFDAANRCCYSADGLLVQTTDYGSHGSVPMRSDIGGTPPYINSGIVPYMSYLLSDEMPRRYCCEWSTDGDCRKYVSLRPTTDCVSYRPNYIASLYGQGHYIAFNEKSSRICHEGDYVLVQAPGVIIQGRYQHNYFNTANDHVVNDSVTLTNIGVRYDSETIEVRLKRREEIRTTIVIEIIVNKEHVRFDMKSPQRQDFFNFIVMNSSNGGRPNVTIILKNGIGVQVEEEYHRLKAFLQIPSKYKSMLSGLLYPESTENIYHTNHSKYKIENLKVPNIFLALMENSSSSRNYSDMCPSLEDIYLNKSEECQGNTQCIYDFKSTRNLTLAISTLAFYRLTLFMKKSASKVQSCSPFPINNGIKSSRNYSVGSTITITGCKAGYILNEGRHTYTCQAIAENQQIWSPKLETTCYTESDVHALLLSMTGFTLGILAAVCSCGAVSLCVLLRRRRIRLCRQHRQEYG